MGVEGYPTIKYFNPPDTEGENYEGGRSLKELKKFAKTLGPGCTRATFDKCTTKQKEELQPFLDMPDEELEAAIEADKTKLKEAQEAHDALMKRLQSEFQASEEKLKALKDDLQPQLNAHVRRRQPEQQRAHVAVRRRLHRARAEEAKRCLATHHCRRRRRVGEKRKRAPVQAAASVSAAGIAAGR